MDALRLNIIESVLMANDAQLKALASLLVIEIPRNDPEPPRKAMTVTVSEAARMLGISRQTVYDWAKAGTVNILPGTSRILRKDVEELTRRYA